MSATAPPAGDAAAAAAALGGEQKKEGEEGGTEQQPQAPKKTQSGVQKEVRSRRYRDSTTEKIPWSYKNNSPKEELLLQHVSEFEQQFISVYGNRFLFLCPPNECGLPKFLPTTIHTTQLEYKELYDLESCAEFVADFLNYEELKPPDRYPRVIPSPTSVLDWAAGDSFDFSIVLCSLLLGVGFDAYCVSGFAPKYITTKNESLAQCPVAPAKLNCLNEIIVESGNGFPDPPNSNSYSQEAQPLFPEALSKRPPYNKSAYLTNIEERRVKDKEKRIAIEMNSDSDDEEDCSEDDTTRIHCWILVKKGKRKQQEDVYIEPSTARIYKVSESPYLRVDLIWNHSNVWVNMQQVLATQIDLDLYNPRFYEYVLLNQEINQEEQLDKIEEGEEGEQPVTGVETIQYLDIPASWTKKLVITQDAFQAKYYQNEKTSFYAKCKLEKYAPYFQVDGLVRRLTNYKDIRRQKPIEIEEIFSNRKDKLVRRLRCPVENKILESFTAGRSNGLKEVEEIYGVRRTLWFFAVSRLDGLEKTIEDIGSKISEWFTGRDDRLIYHSVRFLKTPNPKMKLPTITIEGLGELHIQKMTLKFSRDGGEGFLQHNPNFGKIVFYCAENKIRVDLHGTNAGKIVPDRILFEKVENQLRVVGNTDVPTSDLVDLINLEKNAKVVFQDVVTKLYTEYGQRRKEENAIKVYRRDTASSKEPNDSVIERNVYDIAREKAKLDIKESGEKKKEIEEIETADKGDKVDFLARYLVDFEGKQLDALQAEFVAKKCKNDFRKRLLDRAQIIQRRLEEEQENLKKKRSQMQRRGGENIEKDERAFEQYQSNAMFRIQILEQRLARHEMSAVKKFVVLENAIAEDPRLAAMWQKR